METPWSKGTDLRNEDGFYCWPPKVTLPAGVEPEYFVSVTTVLNMMAADFRFAEHYFAAEYVAEVGQTLVDAVADALRTVTGGLRGGARLNGRDGAAQYVRDIFDSALNAATVGCWDKDAGQMVNRLAVEVLLDRKWMAGAGPRGMTKRANRGQVTHDAVEEWAYEFALGGTPLSADDPGLMDWVASRVSANNYAVRPEDCIDFVEAALRWLDTNVEQVYLAEAPVFNRTYNYAGTCDLMATLRGHEGVWLLDFKTSSNFTPRAAHKIQLCAYRNAEFYGVRNEPELQPMPRADRIGNIYVCMDDRKDPPHACRTVLREWQNGLDTAFQSFIKLREVWQQEYVINAEINDTAVIVKGPKPLLSVAGGELPKRRTATRKETVAA